MPKIQDVKNDDKVYKGLDYWSAGDLEQDVVVDVQGQWRIDKKEFVLNCYLEKIQENVNTFNVSETKKNKLREGYRKMLEKTPLKDVSVGVEFNQLFRDIKLDKDIHLEQDGAGNFYVSDDI